MSDLSAIEKVLETAEISKHWYSIGKLQEDTLCILQKEDGIHIFIFERGYKRREGVYTTINEALKAIKEFLPESESIKLGS